MRAGKAGTGKRYCDLCDSELVYDIDHWQCETEDCSAYMETTKIFKTNGTFSSILGGWVLHVPKGYIFKLPNGTRVDRIQLKAIRRQMRDDKHQDWIRKNCPAPDSLQGGSEAMKCPECGSEMNERDHIDDMETLQRRNDNNPVFGPGLSDYGRMSLSYLRCPKCGHSEKVKE